MEYAVLRALRAHDPELVSDATRIATSLGERGALAAGHISEHVQFLGHEVDVNHFEQALEMRFVEVSKDPWEVGLEHLRRFAEREVHALVPGKHREEDGYGLGSWVNSTRTKFMRGELAPARAAAVNSVPGWTWSPLDDEWREWLERLRVFAAREGTARVPIHFVSEDGFQLGRWVIKQRARREQMTPERVAELEAFPGWVEAFPGWVWDTQEAAWQAGIAHLRAYATANGHGRPPAKYVCDDRYRLGEWVVNKRTKREGLERQRIDDLESIAGWTWNAREEGWRDGIAQLKRYAGSAGHATPPVKHVTDDGFRLGAWVVGRRTAHKDGQLSAERIAELESLPGWTWDVRDDWHEGLERLSAYVDDEGVARPPAKYVTADGFRLGEWVTRRRAEHLRGSLAPERAGQLCALRGWTWDVLDEAWREGLKHLRTFAEEHGEARPPTSHVTSEGFRLGGWVSRVRLRRDKLPVERKAELEALPGWQWDPFEADWQEGLERMRRYAQQARGAAIPSGYVDEDGFKLGRWAVNRRRQRRTGKLNSDRARALEAIPGWTWGASKPERATWGDS